MDTETKRGKIIIGGSLLLTAALFFLRETVAWFLGQALALLPLPKTPEGRTDLAALPWFEIVGGALVFAGLYFIWSGLRQKNRPPSSEPHPATVINTRIRNEVHAARDLAKALDVRVAATIGRVENLAKDARLARVAARRDYLGNLIKRIDDYQQKMREEFDGFSEAARQPRDLGNDQLLKGHQERIDAIRRNLQQLLGEYAGQHVALGEHPNYSINPMKPVGKDKGVPDAEWRQEYRRMWDQMQADKHAVGAVAKLMRREHAELTGEWNVGGKK